MTQYQQIKLDLDNSTFPLISDIVNQISENTLYLFLFYGFEVTDDPNLANNINQALLAIKNKHPSIKIFLVLDVYFEYQQLDIISEVEVIYIDYWPYLVYSEICLKQKSAIVQEWNSQTGKFLFLTGKPNKPNRIRLLYKLTKENLVNDNQCIWSLMMLPDINDTKRFISELGDKQEEFISQYERNPDNITLVAIGDIWMYRGIPYDTKLFQNTSFRIISETFFRNDHKDNPKITEKTWISILNKVPFIMAGDCGTLSKLKSMGFKTFEEYLPIPNYDNIDDVEQRLDAIVHNAKYWLENIADNEEEIRKDIDHNVDNLYKIAKNTWDKLEKIIEYNNIQCVPSDIIATYDPTNRDFKEWYNQIRGTSWPDCDDKIEFYQLPKHIQEECINKFKFNPEEFV